MNFLLPFLNSKNYNNTGSGVYILKYTTANHPGSLLNRREYSTNNSPNNEYEINPRYWIYRCRDTFIVLVRKTTDFKLGWQVLSEFRIGLHIKDINNIIIPFFKKYPILGVKALDFNDWCLGAEIVQSKAHLTPEGLARLNTLKKGMSTGRVV